MMAINITIKQKVSPLRATIIKSIIKPIRIIILQNYTSVSVILSSRISIITLVTIQTLLLLLVISLIIVIG